ncbi:Non-catalytic module family EXPN protein [Rickenella mellea]|uniref:Non-catalytic module family EXPN protein n=1 Tax=Rickenella mellea TaxID=50990 RepID=A0A4Y7QKP6_9AGAM|nr:Non-catalytic module family EXPN protein [Rickenella mellea]
MVGKFFTAAVLVLAGTGSAMTVPSKRQVHSGVATFYEPGLGECGIFNQPSDFIVALSVQNFNNSDCFKNIRVTSGGKSATVRVVDECPTCGLNGLDLSPAAFEVFAPLSAGEISVTWQFV